MATSADKDDRDEDEKDATEGDEAEEKEAPEEEAGDEGEEEEEEEEEAKPAPKPAASAAKPKAAAVAAKPAPKPAAKRPAASGGKLVKAKAPPPRKGGSLGKTLILFVVIVGGLAGAFALLGREDNGPPKWNVGQTLDLDVTLVPSDSRNLACAAGDEIAGRHCAFEAAGKPWSKGESGDDKTLLRPYTTTTGVQFYGAGLWSDPALAPASLPKDDARFSVHCKYKVEGSIKKGQVRWNMTGQWLDWPEHYTGTLSDCKMNAQ